MHRVIHLFPWSGIVDENHQLSDTFRVPDLKTGRMVRLITQLTPKAEEMFRNMIRRMNNLCRVIHEYCCCIRLVFSRCNYGRWCLQTLMNLFFHFLHCLICVKNRTFQKLAVLTLQASFSASEMSAFNKNTMMEEVWNTCVSSVRHHYHKPLD